jgi:hypothetical protein
VHAASKASSEATAASRWGRPIPGQHRARWAWRSARLDLTTGPVHQRGYTSATTGPVAGQSSNGHTATPARRRRDSWGIPRIDPVPTAPAPPIWKTLFGRRAPAGIRRSVRRHSRSRAKTGRGRPGRPQNGGRHAASHSSPRSATTSQSVGPSVAPTSSVHQQGKANPKSSPTTVASPHSSTASTWSTASTLVRPADNERRQPSSATATQIPRRWTPGSIAPDQSSATALTRQR